MEDRVPVWASGRDGLPTCDVLTGAGFGCLNCASVEDLCFQFERGAAVIIVASELLSKELTGCLQEVLRKQAPWSDIPVIVIATEDKKGAKKGEELRDALTDVCNFSILYRPLALDELLASVRISLRARRKQYQMRNLLRQRDDENHRKDEFLAMLAHELRNPLAPIANATEVLKRGPAQDAATSGLYDMIARQVRHLARIVDDLLDVSRVTRGKVILSKQTLALQDSLRNALQAVSGAVRDRNQKLVVTLPEERVYLRADPVRLEQIFGNVLHNAVKFTPHHGVIRVQAEVEDDYVAVQISDSGIGIPRTMLPYVFDLFSQTERSLDRGLGGLGIGLTVVRGFTELHGGQVWISSEGEGKGTQVCLRFPLYSPVDQKLPASSSETSAVNGARRVLIVEDNRDTAESLAMLLKLQGHEVAVAYDGPSAVQCAPSHRPELVLCDIGLPGLDGYQVVKALRGMRDLASATFVAMTGYGQEHDRQRAFAAGFDHHFVKPVDPLMLDQVLSLAQG